jgi:DNA-binding IclR family transcriptional regulator
VVAAIAHRDDGLRLQDVARAAGLTAGAVHHIVATLMVDGWVERCQAPVRYRLGSGLTSLVSRFGQRRLIPIIDAAMVDLLARSGADTISFCEAAGHEVLVTREISRERPTIVRPVADYVLPPYTSAASVVHLAYWPAERAQAFRERRPFETHAGTLWGDQERFQAVLAATRTAGHVDLPLSDPASVRIGFPVLGAGGALVASLTLSAARVADPAALRIRIITAATATIAGISEQLEGPHHV